MAIDQVRKHLKKWGRDGDIMEFATSSATVELAAGIIGCAPAMIAKTIAFKARDGEAMLVVTAGDTKIDNGKFKGEFGFKATMLTPEQTLEFTGHPVGGVCPFGLKKTIPVFLDISLKRFDRVYPACGSVNSALELTCGELEQYASSQKWVDVCKNWIG
jgi:prolyl-tRNA editing enzyme YbaK/EbsC (Cys-tRNA(Pro) deacylase)